MNPRLKLWVWWCVLLATGFAATLHAAPIFVTPSAARPGQVVRLRCTGAKFTTAHNLRIRIGGSLAQIVRVVNADSIHVIVPRVLPDTTTVVASSFRGLLGIGPIIIRDAPTRELVFSFSPSTIRFVSNTRSTDAPTRDIRSLAPRLSFDIVNGLADSLHTCSLPDPRRVAGEIFVGDRSAQRITLRRHGTADSTYVAIRVPNNMAAAVVRIFEVPPGIDLSLPDGRSRRVFLIEFPLDFTPTRP